MTVDSWSMSDSTLQSQMTAFSKVYEASGGTASLRSEDGNSWTTSFTAAFLNDQLSLRLARIGVAQRGLTVTDDDLSDAKSILEQNFTTGGRSVFGDLPGDYQQTLIEGVAAQNVLAAAVLAEAQSDDALRALYESTKDEYDRDLVCASHILVLAGTGSANTTPTEAQYATALTSIAAIRSQLNGASNFAEIAAARSQDTGSAENGGVLPCAPRGSYVAGFEDSVWSLPIGTVSEPVRTQFGYHVILVTARGRLGFDQLKDTLRQSVMESAQQVVNAEITRLASEADISVNGRYGRFDAQTAQITAPAGAATAGTPVNGSSLSGG